MVCKSEDIVVRICNQIIIICNGKNSKVEHLVNKDSQVTYSVSDNKREY